VRVRVRERSGIYANVYDPKRAGHVSVEFRDSKMGYDKDVSLGLPSSSSKQAGVTCRQRVAIRALRSRKSHSRFD